MRGASIDDGTIAVFSTRWIPEKDDSGQWYNSLSLRATDNLSVGFDVRPLSEDFGFLATWRAMSETKVKPALILGTSTDEFDDDDDEVTSQTLYGMLSKRLFDLGSVHVSPYAGAAWIYELDEVRPIGGVHLRYKLVSTLVQYSGTDTHLSVSYQYERNVFSFIHWGLKYPGLAYTRRF